jgi:hypothetical protein
MVSGCGGGCGFIGVSAAKAIDIYLPARMKSVAGSLKVQTLAEISASSQSGKQN